MSNKIKKIKIFFAVIFVGSTFFSVGNIVEAYTSPECGSGKYECNTNTSFMDNIYSIDKKSQTSLSTKKTKYSWECTNGGRYFIKCNTEENATKEQLEEARKKIEGYKKEPKDISLPTLTVTYENPLKVNSFTDLVRNFLTQLQAVIGWITVIMIVVGGLVYITATGRSSQIELGKKIITYALLGFILAVAAPSILKEIFDLASSGKGSPGSDVIEGAQEIKVIVGDVMTFVIALVGVIATIAFVITGIQFIAAGGDSSKAEKAKKGLTYAIIGIAVSGAALILVREILKLMGIPV
jgi:hypothetical protein